MEIKISIIVPVYNVDKYLAKCINSIISQTYQNWELILVDDGSKDQSGVICDQFAQTDSRISVFHKPNVGVSSARNFGLTMATGEWVCFIDSDDLIEPTYLDDFGLNKIKADLYVQGYKKIFKNELIELHDFSSFAGNGYIEILAFMEDERIINSPCYKLYNLNIILDNDISFDENTSYGEDHIFSLDYMTHVSSVHYSNTSGYFYMVYGNESLSHRRIPLKDIIYYSKESRNRQLKLLTSYDNRYYWSAINRRQEATITKTIRELFSDFPNYADYKLVHEEYSPLIKKQGLYGLSIKRMFFMIIFGYLPPKFTYNLLIYLI